MIRMELGEPDESGRRRPVVVADSNFRKPYEVLIMAIGQGPNPLLARLTPYLKTTKWGQLVIDPKSCSSTRRTRPRRERTVPRTSRSSAPAATSSARRQGQAAP